MMDLVFPKQNENEFIKIAEQLNIKNLCFVYPLKEFDKIEKIKNSKITLYFGTILKPNELRKLKKPAELVVVKDSNKNRKVLESKGIDVLFDLENHKRKDFIHHRNSGLNQVLCNLANKNKIIIGFNFNSVLKSEPVQCSTILGRMMQNVRLCRKYKIDMITASFATSPYEMRSLHDLRAFARLIGMQPGEANNSVKILHERIQKNKRKQSPGYVAEGLEIIK